MIIFIMVSSCPALLFVLVSVQLSYSNADPLPYYAPGNSSWLGPSSDDSNNPPIDYKQYLPINYVIFGPNGALHVRSIVDELSSECPAPIHAITQKLLGTFLTRLSSDDPQDLTMMPYKFPVKVCEHIVYDNNEGDKDARDALDKGHYKLDFEEKTHSFPIVKRNPKRFLLTGDTGLRLKPVNLGKCFGFNSI